MFLQEVIYGLERKCKDAEERLKNNPNDDVSLSDWGSLLLHMSMVCDEQEKKVWYLEQGMEKLQRALSINEDSRSSEGELAIFALGNASYFLFFLEKDDGIAEGHLKFAKQQFELAKKRDPHNSMFSVMLDNVRARREALHSVAQPLKARTLTLVGFPLAPPPTR